MKIFKTFFLYTVMALTSLMYADIPTTLAEFQALSPEQQQEIIKEALATQAADQQKAAEISAYQELHSVWSKQLDTVTALLQQLVACMQKGTLQLKDKRKVLGTLAEYIDLIQTFQVRTTTSEKEVLFQAVTVSKNIIDHLTVTVAQGLDGFAIPDGDYLMSPPKNAAVSGEYIKQVLLDNEQKLSKLEDNVSKIGLTWTNKALRATEKLISDYKRPLIIGGVLTAAGLVYYHQESLKTQGAAWGKYLSDSINAPRNPVTGDIVAGDMVTVKDAVTGAIITVPAERLPFNRWVAKNLTIGFVGVAVFKEQLTKLGNYVVDATNKQSSHYYFLARRKLADLYSQAKGIEIERKDGFYTKISEVTLEDCVGMDEQKAKLFEIVDFLEDAEPAIRSGNMPEKGVLMVGGSGNGKTMLAKSLAAQINKSFGQRGQKKKIKFLELNHEDLFIRNVQLIDWIKEAMRNAPCIIFIDELHLYGLKKDGDKALLSQFLTQMHELHAINDPDKQVFIIAATNHPELLAPELFKHKRFGTVITFKSPSIAERYQFFAVTLEKYGISHPSLNLDDLVLQTHGCNYSHLQQVVTSARFIARNEGQPVQQRHLQGAINSLIHGIAATCDLTQQEALVASADQAGKTLAHVLLAVPETIQLTTINKVVNKIQEEQTWWSPKKENDAIDVQYGKLITTTECEEIKNSSSENLEKLCKRLLAGACAQKLLHGFAQIDYSAQDYQSAVLLAQKIVTRGLPISSLPDLQRTNICQQTEELVKRFEKEVEELLAARKDQLTSLSQALLQEKVITGARITQLIN